MKKVIIIGCGFGGISVIKTLSRHKAFIEIMGIDKGKNFNFLPLLPDTIGRGINLDYLVYPIISLAKRYGFSYVNEEVKNVDLEKKIVFTDRREMSYDYLVISSGSETNFYGSNEIKRYAYKLDGAEDANKIGPALRQKEYENYVIVGGGYTGVEIATNLKRFLNKIGSGVKITIVEHAASILGPLPQWIKDYAENNLKKLDIDILLNTDVEKIEKDRVQLSGNKSYKQAMLIWTAGVKTSDYIKNLDTEKAPQGQGRIKVDKHLRINESCFVIGDAAYVPYGDGFLRMAVQFAITQGKCAAVNIINSIKKHSLIEYKPIDLGYIIPMANNKSCGIILGLNLAGFLPIWLHFLMCVYRSYSLRNKLGIIKDIIRGGGKL